MPAEKGIGKDFVYQHRLCEDQEGSGGTAEREPGMPSKKK